MMLRDALVGTWTLVSYTERSLPDGPVTYPHGPDALGLIMYTPDGHMSAQIMTHSRPPYDRPVASGGTAEESAAAATGYLATAARTRSTYPPATSTTTSWCRYCRTGSATHKSGTANSTVSS